MILEPTLVTFGQLFIVKGGFLAQKLKVKCICNVFGDTFLMLSRNIFYDHDASVGCQVIPRLSDPTLTFDPIP